MRSSAGLFEAAGILRLAAGSRHRQAWEAPVLCSFLKSEFDEGDLGAFDVDTVRSTGCHGPPRNDENAVLGKPAAPAPNGCLSFIFEQFGEIPPFVQYAGDLNPITLNAIEDYVGLAEHGPQARRHFVARPPHERLSCETVPGLSDFEKNPIGDFG